MTMEIPQKRSIIPPWLRWVFVALIFVICVFFLDFGEVLTTLGQVSFGWLVLILLIMTGDRLLMAWKWTILLQALKLKVRFPEVAGFYYQGSFVGTFLPSGLGGDFLRAYLLSKKSGDPHSVYASLLMEKIIGFLASLNWAVCGIALLLTTLWPSMPAGWIGGGILGYLSINLAFFLTIPACRNSYIQTLLQRFSHHRPVEFIQRLLVAYAQFGDEWRPLLWNGILTIAENGLQLLIILMLVTSLGIDVSPVLFLAMTTLYLLIYRIPISPDGWGVGEVAAIGLYGLIGLPAESAFALAFLGHILQTVVVLPGMWFLLKSPTSSLPRFEKQENSS